MLVIATYALSHLGFMAIFGELRCCIPKFSLSAVA